jgi:hypothetical protein
MWLCKQFLSDDSTSLKAATSGWRSIDRPTVIIAVGFGFALNTHPKLKRVSDLYRCAAKISSGSLVLRCVKEFAMRAGAEGGRTLKTCLVILLLNTPSQSRCRALKPPEMVGKSAKVDSGILCHSGQLERGTKTRIATLRAHVGADK